MARTRLRPQIPLDNVKTSRPYEALVIQGCGDLSKASHKSEWRDRGFSDGGTAERFGDKRHALGFIRFCAALIASFKPPFSRP